MHSLLALFPFGSEVRQFGHSGLLSRLLDRGWKVTVAARVADDDLAAQLDPRLETVSLPARSPDELAAAVAAVIQDRSIGRAQRRTFTSTQLGVPPPGASEATAHMLERLSARPGGL